jgi:DNA-directed RNA polymerase specialized sigma24 family protein
VRREIVAQPHPREVHEIARLAREVDRAADRDEVRGRAMRENEPHGEAAAVADPVGLGIAPSAALTLVDLQGWSVPECAAALELSESAVRALLRAGRESVRAALEAEVDSS